MKKKLIALSVALSIVLSLCGISVQAEERIAATDFPDKTIIIGTHAIYLDALTDTHYEVATASSNTGTQYNVYFKSDINSGTWYDITSSSQVIEITTTNSNIVTNQVIDALPLTHYTDATGKTIEFSSGEQVYLSDVDSPDSPRDMSEMEALLSQETLQSGLKDAAEDDDEEDIYAAKLASIKRVLADFTSVEAMEKTEQLHAMEDAAVGGDMSLDEKNTLMTLIGTLQDERDALYYEEVETRILAELEVLDYVDASDLMDTYNEILSNMTEISASLGADSSSNTAYAEAEEALTEAMLAAATSGDTGAMADALAELELLEFLENGGLLTGEQLSESQQALAQSILEDVQASAMLTLQAMVSNDGIADALSAADGSSDATVAQTKVNLAVEASYALMDVIGVVDNLLAVSSASEQAVVLENLTNQVSTMIASSSIGEELDASMGDLLADLESDLLAVKSSLDPVYVALLEEVTALQDLVTETYETYMEKLEDGSLEEAEAIKSQIEQASALLDAKTNELAEQAAVVDAKTASEVEENADTSADATATTTPVISALEEDLLSPSVSELAEEQKDLYSAAEQSALSGDGAPWYLIFSNYSGKLSSSIVYVKDEIYVPAEDVGAILGAQVMKSGSVYVIRKQGAIIEFTMGDSYLYVNDRKMSLQPITENGMAYIPLAAFESAFYMDHYTSGNYIIVG